MMWLPIARAILPYLGILGALWYVASLRGDVADAEQLIDSQAATLAGYAATADAMREDLAKQRKAQNEREAAGRILHAKLSDVTARLRSAQQAQPATAEWATSPVPDAIRSIVCEATECASAGSAPPDSSAAPLSADSVAGVRSGD